MPSQLQAMQIGQDQLAGLSSSGGASLLTMPQITVEVAFGSGPYAPLGLNFWTDITPFVRKATTNRGRQHELQRFQAGVCVLTLNNQDGRFSPWNTGGPYGPQLVPGTPVRIIAQWQGTSYNVYTGFIDSWVPAYGKMAAAQAVSASDSLKLLSAGNLDRSSYAAQIQLDNAYSYFQLNDNGGPVAMDTILTPGFQALVAGNAVLGAGAGPMLGGSPAACQFNGFGYLQTNIPFIVSDTTQTFEIWAQSGNPTVAMSMLGSRLFQVAFTSSGHVQVQFNGSTMTAPFATVGDQNWHHIVVTFSGGGTGTMLMYVDGIFTATSGYSNFVPLYAPGYIGCDSYFGATENGWIGNLAQVAFYSYALSPTQIKQHFQLGSAGWLTPQFTGQRIAAVLALLGWPIGEQSIANGITQVQAATSSLEQTSALSYIQQLEASEQGQFFVDESGELMFLDRHYQLTALAANTSNGTFASDNNPAHFHYMEGSIIPASDDIDLWTDVLASRQGGNLQQATSTILAEEFGYRTLNSFTGLLQDNDEDVIALAQWLLAHYGVPQVRVRQMAIDNTADAGANFPQMLGRKLMDRITVDWLPLDGTTQHFVQDSLVESIQHDIEPGYWKTTWGLSPAEVQDYMILNDSVRGKLDTAKVGY